ncbi:response regulator [Pseudomonas sp. MOB-449]|nr:response regulator [Pseudomonas sp. MOB-449]
MIKIQIVDDEPHILSALRRLLRPQGWELHAFTDAQQALQALTEHEYAAIVSDYKMPSLDGITYLQFAKQRQPHALRMVLSGHGDRESMMQAINRAEIYRFLSKPWEDYEIETSLRAAIDLYQLRSENQRLLERVRRQRNALERQRRELLRLEAEQPGITRVRRDAEGALLLGDDELDEDGHG